MNSEFDEFIDHFEILSFDKAIELCQDPNTPIDLLNKIIEYFTINENIFVLWSLAQNIKTSKKALEILSTHYYANIVMYVAENTNTPIEVLEKLSQDSNLAYSLSRNTSTPNEILKELLNDGSCKEEAFKTLIQKKNLKLFT